MCLNNLVSGFTFGSMVFDLYRVKKQSHISESFVHVLWLKNNNGDVKSRLML